MLDSIPAAALRSAALVLLCLALGCAAVPTADRPIEWKALDDWSVFVVTRDEDGSERVVRIWIAVVDGAGAIRTKTSRWGQNLVRGSGCALRVDGIDYPVDVAWVNDPEERRRIDAAFRAKYGWQDSLVIGDGRGESDDPYMRLTARGR